MDNTNGDDALAAISDAAAVVALTITLLDPEEAILDILPTLERLARAVSRVQTLVALHPEITRAHPLPRGSLSPGDAADRTMTIDALETALAMPSEPVPIILRANLMDDGSAEGRLRRRLNGHVITGTPQGNLYTADVTSLVTIMAQEFLPPEPEPLSTAGQENLERLIQATVPPALRALRERTQRRPKEE
jgi:hypothetical protein